MAKKVQQIKDEQGYTKDHPVCFNCFNFSCGEEKKGSDTYGWYIVEVNLRCNLGGFACKKSTWCPHHEFKKEDSDVK